MNKTSNARKTYRLHFNDNDDAFTRILGIFLRWLVEVNSWPILNVTVRNEHAYNLRRKSVMGVSHS